MHLHIDTFSKKLYKCIIERLLPDGTVGNDTVRQRQEKDLWR